MHAWTLLGVAFALFVVGYGLAEVLMRVFRPELAVNTASTPTKTILQQMNEPRPLPMGQKEFVEWSNRILSGAMVPSDDRESLTAVLASMLMNLGQTESHKPDAYFIHSLRKAAVNEVAHANFRAIKDKKAAESAKSEPAKPPLTANEQAFQKAATRARAVNPDSA